MAATTAVDRLISRILNVELQPDGKAYPKHVYLQELAQERMDEGADSLLLTKDVMDRALMSRLLLPPNADLQWPLHYLLDVYSRASNELRSSPSTKDKALAEELQDVAAYAQELAISHANLALSMDMFPQTPEARARGAKQLLDAMDRSKGLGPMTSSSAMPPGFLERFAAQYEEEGLAEIVAVLVGDLNEQLLKVSLIGDFQRPLQHLIALASIQPIARTMTKLPAWTPQLSNGRELQTHTLLGPAFSVTTLPDQDAFFGGQIPVPPAQPDAVMTLFHSPETRQNEVIQGAQSVRLTAQGLQLMLWQLTMAFLRPQGTREAMLRWFALSLESNREHNKDMPDITKAAPRGLMKNLAAVLLKVCEPFIDPASGKAWGKLDTRYVQEGRRLDYSGDTRMHLTSEEQSALAERTGSHATAEPSSTYAPHFICECYFMTARALHLGYIKAYTIMEHMGRAAAEARRNVQQLRQVMEQSATMPQLQLAMARRQLQQMEEQEAKLSGGMLCYQSEIMEKGLVEGAVAFYRLTAAWLLRVASPSYAAGLAPDIPLPPAAPEGFRMLPEYLISDMVELLKTMLQYQSPDLQRTLETAQLEELVLFIIASMPASSYINNIYLRAQLGEILGYLLPREEDEEDNFPSRTRRRQTVSAVETSVATLLDTNTVIQQSLVTNLLQLFVEIERTGRHNQFYEKFEVRQDIGRILIYLWKSQTHREVWIKTARTNQDLYSRFNYFLETDATLHLDDALKLLQEERDYQKLSDPEQQQQQALSSRGQRVRMLRFHLHYAGMMLRIIRMTTAVIWQPWLQAQAVRRVAGTLNYFLKYLTGPERKQLRVKDTNNELSFDPKDLLTQIASIYVNLARRDSQGVFAQAITADKRSYYEDMFAEATQVLRHFGLLPADAIDELDQLSLQASAAVHVMEAEDAAEAEAPEEFFDPIMSEIMENPVTLPSGMNVERETILRHMMSDPTDPYSRTPITEADLKPNLELKARIEQWKAERSGRAPQV